MTEIRSEAPTPSPPVDSPILLVTTRPHPNEPPPPYPSQSRRTRRSRRRAQLQGQISPQDLGYETFGGTRSLIAVTNGGGGEHIFPNASEDHETTENTPLLHDSSPRSSLRRGAVVNMNGQTRQRSMSHSSTIYSSVSGSTTLAQTLLSAMNPDLDSDVDGNQLPAENMRIEFPDSWTDNEGACGQRHGVEFDWKTRCKRYIRPIWRRAYYSAVFHLLVLNFPFALAAWVYLFVFTLTGTTLLMALPLGALLCFFNLLGARTFARVELALQSTFHGPLAYDPYPVRPIFYRLRHPALSDIEAGTTLIYDNSFYRNAYAMFTDATSYQALFYFLVIKPSTTLLLGIGTVVLVPLSFVLIFPAPAMLRIVRRLGIWQANIAVEGLYPAVR